MNFTLLVVVVLQDGDKLPDDTSIGVHELSDSTGRQKYSKNEFITANIEVIQIKCAEMRITHY